MFKKSEPSQSSYEGSKPDSAATYSLYPSPSPTDPKYQRKGMAFSIAGKAVYSTDPKARPQTRAGGVLGIGPHRINKFSSAAADRPAFENIDPNAQRSAIGSVTSDDFADGMTTVGPMPPPSQRPATIPEERPEERAPSVQSGAYPRPYSSAADMRPLSRAADVRPPSRARLDVQPSELGSELETPDSRGRPSMSESAMTYDTEATSVSTLPALQARGPAHDYSQLSPVSEDDPTSYDLLTPSVERIQYNSFSLEARSDKLFSTEHLQAIFNDPPSLLKFTSFLGTHRPTSVPILIYYLDALKALRAIRYANAVAEALDPLLGHEFTNAPPLPTRNAVLEEKAARAFQALVEEDLPAFITDTWIRVVSQSIQKRISGTLPPHLREASEGLAEVFCLSDPSRPDNPIVFASEEFHRTTQYGMNYAIGRNCRFLQGPRTCPTSIRRLKDAVVAGREHCETFVNYRRDGSAFMNLLMIAPLKDSRGNLRYYIGAQVDVTGLAKECTHLDALQRSFSDDPEADPMDHHTEKKDEFQELSEMLNMAELDIVRKFGGHMHREHVEDKDSAITTWHRPRLLLQDHSAEELQAAQQRQDSREQHGQQQEQAKPHLHGKLLGVYQHYLLIRPYPSLRILFASPSLRVPGILQSPFMNRIGGSERVRDELVAALADGRGVTAKIRWVSRSDDEGRNRWVHCTPLVGANGNIGVWMVVLVDDEASRPSRRFRAAPPVSMDINGKMYEPSKTPTPYNMRPITPGPDKRMSSEQQNSEFDFRI